MKYLIATIKEQPWHVTLRFSLFIVLLISTVAFFVDKPRLILALAGGLIGGGLTFWSLEGFVNFMASWEQRKQAVKDYKIPENELNENFNKRE